MTHLRLPVRSTALRFVSLVLFCCVVLCSRSAAAYPWMIRHGYAGCAVCHADPSGGGLLTPYGRAQGDLLLHTHYSSVEKDDESAANFLFGAVPLPDSLLLGGDVRGLYLYVKPQYGPTVSRTILMQADAEAQVSVGRFRFNGSLGYAHEGAFPASVTRGVGDRLVSRVLWAGADLDEGQSFLLRVGRMNLPFGIRSIEHTLWVRSSTLTDSNDSQQHGAALAYNGEAWRGELMLIAGNFQEHPDAIRRRGYAGFLEYAAAPRLGVGLSSLITHTSTDLVLGTPLYSQAHGLFLRYSPIPLLAFLAESDLLLQSQPSQNAFGIASMAQGDLEIIQGLHLMGTAESLDRKLSALPPSYGLWGTLAWFCLPQVDVRFDTIWQSLGSATSRVNGNVLLAQLHAYL